MAEYEGEILKASHFGKEQIQVGMEVLSSDGQHIGKVKEVREADFLVDRPLARDVFVPYEFVMGTPHEVERMRGAPMGPTEVVISVSAAHVDTQGWQHN
jgi:hypothetical protein